MLVMDIFWHSLKHVANYKFAKTAFSITFTKLDVFTLRAHAAVTYHDLQIPIESGAEAGRLRSAPGGPELRQIAAEAGNFIDRIYVTAVRLNHDRIRVTPERNLSYNLSRCHIPRKYIRRMGSGSVAANPGRSPGITAGEIRAVCGCVWVYLPIFGSNYCSS